MSGRIAVSQASINGQKGFVKRLVGLTESQLLWADPLCPNFHQDLYCQQLNCLNEAIARKRPAFSNGRGIVFYLGHTHR